MQEPGYQSKSARVSDEVFDGAIFVIGAESNDVVNIAIQLTRGGVAVAEPLVFFCYTSGQDDGRGISATIADGSAIGTNGVILSSGVQTHGTWYLETDASGRVDLDITETGTLTLYVVVVTPTGRIIVATGASWT